MTCNQVRLTPPFASSLSGPESGSRAGWILQEKSWTWSPRTCSLPKRVIARRQHLRSGSPAVPTIHMQQTAGDRRLSQARTPAFQPCLGRCEEHWLWGSARPGFKCRFPNGVAYSFGPVASVSELSYPHLTNGVNPKL